jgi:hypothetical protein
MTPGDIHFLINNRRINPQLVFGSMKDVSFFDQLKDHLTGDCIVRFKVGNKTVENKVILKRMELRVENNFVSYNIDSFIKQQKERVTKEKENAQFVESPTDIFFIPAQSLLACNKTFPDFDRSQLAKDPQGPRFFVSHRWLSTTHPDPKGRHLALLKLHAAAHKDAFYWIDFSCLPQSRNAADEELFNNTLPKIASIQAKASTIIINEADYHERLWCYIELFAGVLFSQTNLTTVGKIPRTIEYLGNGPVDHSILEKILILKEPAWDKFKVTKLSDIPGIKYNYTWLAKLVKFQLYDRFSELRNSLPGNEIYSGIHYPQSAFGIDYQATFDRMRPLFTDFGGDIQHIYNDDALLWLAERFSWSVYPDEYSIEDLQFSDSLVHSEEMVGWIAILLGIITIVNKGEDKIYNLRDVYAKIVLMSFFR